MPTSLVGISMSRPKRGALAVATRPASVLPEPGFRARASPSSTSFRRFACAVPLWFRLPDRRDGVASGATSRMEVHHHEAKE